MTNLPDYASVNKALWNAKTPWHVQSAFYDMDAFRAGKDEFSKAEDDLLEIRSAALAATATSLEIATGRPIDREALFTDAVARLEGRLGALAEGRFDVANWRSRQLLAGCEVELVGGAGEAISGRVVGHDGASGALILSVDGTERAILAGEVTKVVRIAIP
jgi:biotin-(acetyl-CoA carboxylase) ligase